MMQMTEKKAKRLEESGAELVGFIYRDSNDGRLAYVEGAAVRWLDADKREAFMFPHGRTDSIPPPPPAGPACRHVNEDKPLSRSKS